MASEISLPSPLRILLVEDSAHDVTAFKRALNKGGLAADITIFTRAEDAIPTLAEHPLPYDIVVADYKLPGITGLELCKQIIDQDTVPCIILTGAGSENIAVKALQEGVSDYLVKDYQQDYLQILPLFLQQVVAKHHDHQFALVCSKEREVVAAISEMFLTREDPTTIYQKLPQALAEGLSFPIAAILLLDENGTDMVVKGISGLNDRSLLNSRISIEQTGCYQTIAKGEPILKLDIASSPDQHCFLNKHGVKSCLTVPIKSCGNNVIGALVLADRHPRPDAGIHNCAMRVIAHHLAQEIARREVEDALRKSKQEWSLTFDSLTDIVTVQDKDMHIVRANKAAHALFHAKYGELNGRLCYELFSGKSEPCPNCPLLESLRDIGHHSEIIRHKNLGKIFRVSSSVITDDNGDIKYLAHVASDITEQKKLEEELFQAHKMEAMGTLAGGIAHDFNNILAIISGYAELAKDAVQSGGQPQNELDQIFAAAKRAAELVQQILTFSHKKSDHQQPLMPHIIVKESLKMLRATLPSTILLDEKIDKECGTIMANPTDVHQIVVNLCTNAFHAMENEKGTLTIELYRKNVEAGEITEIGVSPGSFIILSISDTGMGIDKKTMEHIFEPYFTTKKVGKGTGLGLAVIHGIVNNCQGFIKVESTPGAGTTFHIYLPALENEAAPQEQTEQVSTLPGGTERILVVDDESHIVDLQERILADLGYFITSKTDSREALEIFREHPEQFDLLITDQTMPNMSGIELAREVLKIKPDMPIILCTGYSSVISEEGALALGIKKYAKKPIERRDLAAIVRDVLDGN